MATSASGGWRRLLSIRGIMLFFAVWAGPALAQPAGPTESAVEAAFIYQFAGFVQWPEKAFPGPDSAITIGIVGSKDIYAELQRIVPGRTSQGRAFKVIEMTQESELANVHIAYIERKDKAELRRWLKASEGKPVLVVSAAPDALELGSIINFVMDDNRVRFEISALAAANRQLVLSSRLLTVAFRIKKSGLYPERMLAYAERFYTRGGAA